MSKSYRGWAEVEDWAHREARRQAKRKATQDWKTEAARELEQMAEPEEIYVVVNEWTYNDYNFEATLGYHRTKAGAWLSLQAIAEGREYELDHDEYSFSDGDEDWYVTTGTLED